jgi:hypothetical protein
MKYELIGVIHTDLKEREETPYNQQVSKGLMAI